MNINREAIKQCPSFLYMYVTLDDFKKIIKEKRIPITLPWKSKDNIQSYHVHSYADFDYGYISLSGTCTSPSMWGYYAGKSTGMCLIFEIIHLNRRGNQAWEVYIASPHSSTRLFPTMYAVRYTNKRIVGKEQASPIDVKADEWSYEQEYRIHIPVSHEILEHMSASSIVIGVEENNQVNFYSETFLKFLRGVIIGPECSLKKTDVEALLNQHKCYNVSYNGRRSPLSIAYARVSKTEFAFEVDSMPIINNAGEYSSWGGGVAKKQTEKSAQPSTPTTEQNTAIQSLTDGGAQNNIVLYMYAPLKDFLNIIRGGDLYISRSWSTNDITEGVKRNEVCRLEDVEKQGYICLSKICTSPSMWSNYADGARGVCLAFTFDDMVYDEENAGWRLGDTFFMKKLVYQSGRCETDNPYELLSIKSTEWQHEQEYRIFVPLNSVPHDLCILKEDGSVTFKTAAIMKHLSGIIIGAKCDRKLEEIRVILEKAGITYGDTDCIPKITRARMSETTFSFEVDEKDATYSAAEVKEMQHDLGAIKGIYGERARLAGFSTDEEIKDRVGDIVVAQMKQRYSRYLGKNLTFTPSEEAFFLHDG